MLERLKRENPNYPLTTESCVEPYMDVLDGVIVCNSTGRERCGGTVEIIPLFQSVYHGKFAFFGNYAHPEFTDIRRFTLETARFYYTNRPFLFDGEMLSPAGFTCAIAPVDFMVRMIFTKESESRTIHKTIPAILHSCWKSPDGKKALILVNWTDKDQPWTFNGLSGTLPAHSYDKKTCPDS